MTRLVYDIEADGLLEADAEKGIREVSRVWCIVTQDVDTGEVCRYFDLREGRVCGGGGTLAFGGPEVGYDLDTGVLAVAAADVRIGHGILEYDEKVLARCYPNLWKPTGRVLDTLIGARVVWPDEHMKHMDFIRVKRAGNTLPKNLIGRHALQAWGHRLGLHKGGYEGDFQAFTPEMLEYCTRDVAVTALLFRKLDDRIKRGALSLRAWKLEQEYATILALQERHGLHLDVPATERLVAKMQARRAELADELGRLFAPEVQHYVTPVRREAKTRTIPYNPSSRMQTGRLLMQRHGWEPTKWTEGRKGKDGKCHPRPQVDESTLAGLSFPGCAQLVEYYSLDKAIGTLAEGAKGYLQLVGPDGRIHGRIHHNAAVTSRSTHSSPNLANIPGGKDVRGLFTAPPGRVLVDADVKALEPRAMAHHLYPLDGGDYMNVVLGGDIHLHTMKMAGLKTRQVAKVWGLAFNYGARAKKLASIAGTSVQEAERTRLRFLHNMPALARLQQDCAMEAMTRGGLRLPDGRLAHVRHSHAALNTLIQGTGAIIAKVLTVLVHRKIVAAKLDVHQVAMVHDELLYEARPEHVEALRAAIVASAAEVATKLGLRVPIEVDVQVGKNWGEVHA